MSELCLCPSLRHVVASLFGTQQGKPMLMWDDVREVSTYGGRPRICSGGPSWRGNGFLLGWSPLRVILVGVLDHAGGEPPPPAGVGYGAESPLLVGSEVWFPPF